MIVISGTPILMASAKISQFHCVLLHGMPLFCHKKDRTNENHHDEVARSSVAISSPSIPIHPVGHSLAVITLSGFSHLWVLNLRSVDA